MTNAANENKLSGREMEFLAHVVLANKDGLGAIKVSKSLHLLTYAPNLSYASYTI